MDAKMGTERRASRTVQRTEEFYCKNRRRRLAAGKCLDDYLDANALEHRRSACFRCYQGKRVRKSYSCGH